MDEKVKRETEREDGRQRQKAEKLEFWNSNMEVGEAVCGAFFKQHNVLSKKMEMVFRIKEGERRKEREECEGCVWKAGDRKAEKKKARGKQSQYGFIKMEMLALLLYPWGPRRLTL